MTNMILPRLSLFTTPSKSCFFGQLALALIFDRMPSQNQR